MFLAVFVLGVNQWNDENSTGFVDYVPVRTTHQILRPELVLFDPSAVTRWDIVKPSVLVQCVPGVM